MLRQVVINFLNKFIHRQDRAMENVKQVLGIVCPLKTEAHSLLSWLNEPTEYGFKGHRWLESKQGQQVIVVVVSNPGRRNVKKATLLMIEHHSPQWIINFGTAGAIAPHLGVGDIVVATATAEYQRQKPDSVLLPTSEELWKLAEVPNIHQGPIVSADKVIGNEKMKQELYHEYGALCGDWESAVVMRLCHEHQIQGAAFRVISDLGDMKAIVDFRKNHVKVLNDASTALQKSLIHAGILTKSRLPIPGLPLNGFP